MSKEKKEKGWRPGARPAGQSKGRSAVCKGNERRDARRATGTTITHNYQQIYHYVDVLVNRCKFQPNVLSKALILKNPSTRVLDSGFSHLIMTRYHYHVACSTTFILCPDSIIPSCEFKALLISVTKPLKFLGKKLLNQYPNIYPYQYLPQVPRESVAKVSTVH